MSKFEERILHLGLGRFHRAHQAVYYQRMFGAGDNRWGCVSYSMRSDDARNQMRAVQNHYPVVELGHNHEQIHWIESIQRVGSVSSEREQCLEDFANPKIEIVTLTITEKGYAPESDAIQLIVAGIKKRRKEAAGPLTIMSCDNLRGNGKKLSQLVKSKLNPDELKWVDENICFPSTMVDRIVPALTPQKVSELEQRIGKKDTELVATEVFSQWVIEDNFAHARPDWEKAGVEFVTDVTPYEEIKLRLLNASHSYLAYNGLLAGLEYVHQAVGNEELVLGVKELQLEEVAPLLSIPQGFDVIKYCDNMMLRFQNDQLPHQLKQIGMDGTQKLPQRFFSSLLEAKRLNKTHVELMKGIKAWFQFTFETFKKRAKLDDPQSQKLESIYDGDWSKWPVKIFEARVFPQALPEEIQKEIIREVLS